MPTVRRAPPRSKVIRSLDEFRASLAGQPDDWIEEQVAQEAMERETLERWAQDAYDTKAQRPYTPVPAIED